MTFSSFYFMCFLSFPFFGGNLLPFGVGWDGTGWIGWDNLKELSRKGGKVMTEQIRYLLLSRFGVLFTLTNILRRFLLHLLSTIRFSFTLTGQSLIIDYGLFVSTYGTTTFPIST